MNHQDRYITFEPLDPREKLVRRCPSGCDPPLIFHAIPHKGSSFNSLARCLRCGTYWEVTPKGLIVNKKRWEDKPVLIEKEE
mgnify:CR=1 FL=1